MNSTPEQAGETTLPLAVPSHGAPKRYEFWADTCREIMEMHAGCRQVIDFYRKFGCRFCAPTQEQVEEVLRALDSAMPDWDQAHPELFYQTLELNFPELVRH